MKRILSISIDRSIADSSSAAAERQCAYYAGWQADIVLLATGPQEVRELAPGVGVHISGGSTKAQALLNGYRLARKIAKTKHPDVVTAQDPFWCGLVASSAASVSGAALHLQDHSGFFARAPFTLMEKLFASRARRLALRADRIRTVSKRGAEGLRRIGVDEWRIDVIPIATDVARFESIPSPDMTQKNVLCVARLEKEKGIDVLLDAWKIVTVAHPDACLRVVGDGSLRTSYELRATSFPAGTVEFIGGVSDVSEQFAWSSIVVQPSWFEGWGLAVSEAAAAGRPIVMTDVGCAREVIIDGVSGVVVPVGDTEALANGILQLLNDPSRASSYGSMARKSAEQLPTPAATVEAIRQSFERTKRAYRLLVVAQAVDADDALFGFFVSWLNEAAKSFDTLTVLALRVGRYDLLSNVKVIPLRARGSRSRLTVVWNLLSHSYRLRAMYDGVYVRGDAQYVALAGWLWRLLGKRVVLWYAHYVSNTPWLYPASWFASNIVTSVKAATRSSKAIPIGQAISTDRFHEPHVHTSEQGSALIFGRISPVKRVPWILEEVGKISSDAVKGITSVGTSTDAEEASRLASAVDRLHATWENRDVRNEDAPGLYRAYDVYINATPASLDKTIVEAMLSGLVVVASTDGYGEMLPTDLAWLHPTDAEFGASVLRAMNLSAIERQEISATLRAIAVDRHSQTGQVAKLHRLFLSGQL